jgi:DNA invertase Pin-like site-specific DNA recombinase
MLKSNQITEFHTYSIDRLGRNLRDILNTIEVFSSYKVPIHIISQGLLTYDSDTGQTNPTTKLILQIMGSVAEMERNLTTERIKHSLSVKKLNGELLGRKKGSTETIDMFLNKEKSKKIVKYLNKGLSVREISSIVGCGTQLVIKVKKYSS